MQVDSILQPDEQKREDDPDGMQVLRGMLISYPRAPNKTERLMAEKLEYQVNFQKKAEKMFGKEFSPNESQDSDSEEY